MQHSPPPIRCEHCGKTFVPQISLPVGSTMVTSDGPTTACTNCGEQTRMDDAVFVVTKTGFERISSVAPSPDELEALIRVLTSARAQESPEAAKIAVEEEVPSLAPYLDDYLHLDGTKWRDLLPAILFALGWVWVFIKMPNPATGMKAFETMFAAAKVAFGKHSDGITLGKAAEAGKAAAEQEKALAKRDKNAKKRARQARR